MTLTDGRYLVTIKRPAGGSNPVPQI